MFNRIINCNHHQRQPVRNNIPPICGLGASVGHEPKASIQHAATKVTYGGILFLTGVYSILNYLFNLRNTYYLAGV